MSGRRVLVATVVHHPLDARVRHRQIEALLQDGWQVTYAAPWTAYGVEQPTDTQGLTAIDLPRASGWRRLGAQRAFSRLLRSVGPNHDVVLIHDPELLLTSVGRDLPPVVWDVHEDTAAAMQIRPWVPAPLRSPAAAVIRRAEGWAEGRHRLLLADAAYATRFRRAHAVVPNATVVEPHPAPAGVLDQHGRHRVVYLGSVTMERGVRQLVEVGRRLHEETGDKVRLEVVGPAHGRAKALLAAADQAGHLDWFGFVPNTLALRRLDGALAGLSLLHDEANFRPSMPTKIIEYLAHAVPAISTPLPVAAELVTTSGGGVLVPFLDTDQTVAQLLAWHADPEQAARIGRQGHSFVEVEHNWSLLSAGFLGALRAAADSR
ncbi:MAG: glycosyltransferase family 4 protein [Ornithinimicrobium sp.]|uniref:glycosyltransferase family 4 protein n=1 Tax=Ornithinimicrobium sp. TaxID=1977084 RepID=UPI0026E103E7|nr:glycosyltransferase family 4 protein [Ornithinimicrobium sp.]MDO5739134.1 glycosyltransferase family 4 protein [Ornithinimicrobium sp.]